MKRRLSFGSAVGGVLVAMVFSAGAVAPPWDGDKIVFGASEQGGTFSLDSAASASGVYFRCPATLGGAGPLTLVAPALIYGGGELLTPLAGSDGMAVTNCFSSSRSVFPQKSTWTTIWPNAVLADVVDIAGEVTGIWSGIGIYFPTTLVAFDKAADGLSATAQFHMKVASGVPRAFKLAFQQNGANVEAQILWAKYSSDPAKFGLDWDNTSGLSNYSGSTFDTSTIGITNLRGTMAPITIAGPLPTGHMAFSAKEVVLRPAANMTISSTFSGTVDKLSIVGSKTSLDDAGPCVTFSLPSKNAISSRPVIVVDGVDVKTTNRNPMPKYYHLIITNNAVFNDASSYAAGTITFDAQILSSETNTLRIAKGCKCQIRGDWAISYANQSSLEVVVDGGELDLFTSSQYINRLSLANGGRVTGNWFVVGYYKVYPLITSSGEGPCVVEGCIRMASPYSGTPSQPHVFDTRCDLQVNGGFKYYTGDVIATLLKKGPATLSVGYKDYKLGNGTWALGALNPLRIEEGRLLLAANGAFSRTNACALAGGSLDAGVYTNRLGVLTLDGNSAIALGNGQLTFSDSSSAAWAAGAVLSVTGPDQFLKKGRLRFLSAGGHEGLSAAQLAAVRYNGDRHVKLDGEGWLRSYMPGITISVR